MIILGICVGYGLLFHGFFSWLSTQSASTIDSLMPLAKFMVTFRIDALAFGSLAAWLLHTNHPFLKYLRSPSAYLISTGIAAWLFLRSEKAPSYYPIALSICFAVILLNIVQDRRASLVLETRVMNYLGRISYGIYMWHPVAIVLAFTSVKAAPFSPWIHYPLTLALTVAIAAFSYHVFEVSSSAKNHSLPKSPAVTHAAKARSYVRRLSSTDFSQHSSVVSRS
ncbi:MAG: acyltransferase [Verrucomicrobiaceae bacterium]|nr:acyltransferase [Verrucomicrobiaceae bacterium]